MTSLDSSFGGSRHSKTNCPGPSEQGETPECEVEPDNLCGRTGLRPLSVDGESLRHEAALLETEEGYDVPAESGHLDPADPSVERVKSRPWYKVVREWRRWYKSYENRHITFERDDGKTVRTRLENAYQPGYANRYYAKLKDFEREAESSFEGLTTVMLTLSASTLNEEGSPRCPADHMREIQNGWDTARKELYRSLSAFEWEYARVWEPTSETGKGPAGYGHLHVAIFIDSGDRDVSELGAGRFASTMRRYVEETPSAHPAAHTVDGSAVSINHSVGNLGSYVSEYIGSYGERATERPMHEQQFYATVWATGTRRVSFSQGANEMQRAQRERRRETETTPEQRGGDERDESGAESLGGGREEHEWGVRCVCRVAGREPHRSDPTSGGVETVAVDERDGVDPPRQAGWEA